LASFARIVKTRQRKQRLLSAAIAAGSACLLFMVSYLTLANLSAKALPQRAAISCAQVLQSVDQYFRAELEEDYRVLVRQHIEHCPHCRDVYRQRSDELGIGLVYHTSATADVPKHHNPATPHARSYRNVAHLPPGNQLVALRAGE
jgi:hypothetical protein